MRPFEQNAFTNVSQSYRPIMDTVFSAIIHGMVSRHPVVRLGLIETGSRWITRVVEDLSDGYGKLPHLFAEEPLGALRRAFYVAPFWEDPLEPLIGAIGLDHVLFNSDWPHPEGLADPLEYSLFAKDEVGLSDADVAKIMGDNMFELMGVAV
jgi:predicted TIM-barrel fold metal-dependent hydrolase